MIRYSRLHCWRNTQGLMDDGGRGIVVCADWRESFPAFLRDMGEPPEGLTLDRINPNGNYEKANCRWASWDQQHNNTRSSILVEFRGEIKSVTQWCRVLGLRPTMILSRIRKGMDPVVAFTTPHRSKNPKPWPCAS